MSYTELKKLFKEQSILSDINGLLNWDMATYMPSNSRSQRVDQIKTIYEYKKRIFEIIKQKELFKKISSLKLNKIDQQNLDLMQSKFNYFNWIPSKLIEKKTILSIECEGLWRQAREKNSFNVVKNKLYELIRIVKEESEILSQKKQINKYDSLLQKYDRSLNTKFLNKVFPEIEKFIKSNLKIIRNKQKHDVLLEPDEYLNESEQIKLSKIFMEKLGFDFSIGRIDKSLHPFCGGSSNDIRITTRFDEKNAFSCFDALMHETGHAIYEQGLPEKYMHQPVGSAGGMSLHESQSLFIEMQLIKSKPASKYIEKVIRKDLKKNSDFWTCENIFSKRSKVEKSYIRVDADEVHYPLHIIHRFNIEIQIIENNQDIRELPEIWNHEFEKIFNLRVPSDNLGCLQDIHWYGGDFGYFPTYSIGAFIASQIKYAVKQDIPEMSSLIQKGEFNQIVSWLKKNVHQYGNLYEVNPLLKKITSKELDLSYFKKHIKERYINKKF